ncbi:MAG: hypothetical protein KJP06_07970 [Deltaproteobacteria bacterium]|nr:hypothetical protein [Deltaproteobacteria bacterium]
MFTTIFRLLTNAAIIAGVLLLVRVIYGAVDGIVTAQLLPESRGILWNTAVALGLGLPVPLHVIAIGLVLQRRWLPDWWAKISVPAVVISGCWLGAALAIKFLAKG